MKEPESSSRHGGNAWMIVAFGFVCLALSYSVRTAFSLVIPMLEGDYGWTRTSVSAIASVSLVVMAIVAPVAGRMVDLYAPRVVLVAGAVAMAIGCLLVSVASQWMVAMIAFGVVCGIGFGLIAPHVLSTAVEQGFSSNQGVAISISTSGSTAGQFIIIPIVAFMLTVISWQESFLVLSVVCAGMAVAACRFFPSGSTSEKSSTPSVGVHGNWIDDIAYMGRSPAFHVLFWSYVICGYTTTGIIETHFLPFASYCGIPPVPSATAFGILSLVNMIGMIVAGWLADRFNGALLLTTIYGVRVISFLLLLEANVEYETLVMFSVLFGLVDYSTFPVTARLVAVHLDRRVIGLALGLIMSAHQFGGAAGAYAGGYMYEKYLQYDWVWWSSIGVTAVACVLVLPLARSGKDNSGGVKIAR